LWIIASPTLPPLTEIFLPPQDSQRSLRRRTGKLTHGLIEMQPALALARHMSNK
jgi:hypothetical protein